MLLSQDYSKFLSQAIHTWPVNQEDIILVNQEEMRTLGKNDDDVK